MKASLVSQPYPDGLPLQRFLHHLGEGVTSIELVGAVAWLRQAGVEAAIPAFRRVREAGGSVRLMTGISFGGTSVQGLALALEHVDQLYVVHTSDRTFHPKFFAVRSSGSAEIFIGSNNLTPGGLLTNFELGVALTIDLGIEAEVELHAQMMAYFERISTDTGVCLPVNDIETLLDVADRYRLLDESAMSSRALTRDEPLRTSDEALASAPLFSSSAWPLHKPSMSRSARAKRVTELREQFHEVVVRRWFKQLPAADAQQLHGSNPSNTMTLVRAGHRIDPYSYFRDEFFGDLPWRTTATLGGQQPRETADAPFEIFVGGEPVGTFRLLVRFTPGFDSDQRNRTTELAWEEFGGYLRRHDLTGWFAILERTRAGGCRVRFEPYVPDSALY